MNFRKMKITIGLNNWIALCCFVLVLGCVKDRNFDAQEVNQVLDLKANITFSEVKGRFQNETFQIQEDLVIEGYVSSSDEKGNFFSVLHFQDKPENPSEGFQIEIDLRDSHLFYPEGSKIFIKLKGLYLGKSNEVFKIGGVFTSFGNVSVGRLPANVVDNHVFLSNDEKVTIRPTFLSLENIPKHLTNTLVEINGLEIIDVEIGGIFAEDRKETERMLSDCNGNTIALLNSGFSDFQSQLLPSGNGKLRGILLRKKDDFSIALRTLEDMNFSEKRCEEIITEYTSKQLFISELADPDNNSKARFVELYNASSESLNLKGWKLVRYTNENTEVSSTIDLSGFTIAGETTFVISPNAIEFERVYGLTPEMGVGTNSPADSNGDDNLQLIDPFGNIIDVFGVIGEDGSNTNHEFEDGRAVRNVKINEGKLIYDFTEWRVYNDTGAEETIKEPQNAPEDFTPGKRN